MCQKMASDYVNMLEYCSYVVLVKLGVKPLFSRGSFKSPRRHVTNNKDLKSKTADKTTIDWKKSEKNIKIFRVLAYSHFKIQNSTKA